MKVERVDSKGARASQAEPPQSQQLGQAQQDHLQRSRSKSKSGTGRERRQGQAVAEGLGRQWTVEAVAKLDVSEKGLSQDVQELDSCSGLEVAEDAQDQTISGGFNDIAGPVAGEPHCTGSGPCDVEAGELNVVVIDPSLWQCPGA